MDKATGRLNLAFQGLTDVPEKLIRKDKLHIRGLDLTENAILDFRFLMELPCLEMLILDRNDLQSHIKFPRLPQLETLWINHNKISNLGLFVTMLSSSCPNLRYLSMMDNEAAPSYFNGGSYIQYQDYRHYVISQFPKLEVLDDTSVSKDERKEAERIYGPDKFPPPHIKKHRRRSKKSKQKKNSGQHTLQDEMECAGERMVEGQEMAGQQEVEVEGELPLFDSIEIQGDLPVFK